MARPFARFTGFLVTAAWLVTACAPPTPTGPFRCADDTDCATGGVCVPVAEGVLACGRVTDECPPNPATCLRSISVPDYGCVPAPDNEGEACPIDMCSGGFCQDGACAREPDPCDDGRDCTDDICVPDVGCVHPPVDCPCESDAECDDDTDRCNGVFGCVGGACVETVAPVDCSALEGECTTATCDPVTGECVPVPTPGEPCGDGQTCNSVGGCGPDEQGNSCNEAPDIAPLEPGASTLRIGTTDLDTLSHSHNGSVCGTGSAFTPGKDAVYRLIPSEDATYRMTLQLEGESNVGCLYVFDDCEDPTKTCLVFDKEGGPGGDLATVVLETVLGKAYFIVVDSGLEDVAGDYVLTVCRPDCEGRACGDDGCGGSCGDCDNGLACVSGQCDCPVEVLSCGATGTGLTGQHRGFAESSCSDGVNADDAESVFRFVSAEAQTVTMSVTWSGTGGGNPPSGSMAIYQADPATCVPEGDMTCVAGVTNATSITFDAEAGQAYRWLVEPNGPDVAFDYVVECP